MGKRRLRRRALKRRTIGSRRFEAVDKSEAENFERNGRPIRSGSRQSLSSSR